jgi:hypothetical protein
VTIPLATNILPTWSYRLKATREFCIQITAQNKENDDRRRSTWTVKNNETQIKMH